jgi:hypothetical protein
MPDTFPFGSGPRQRRVAAALLITGLLALPIGASAAPWRSHLTLPAGDEVLLRTQGRALRPAGSRAEIDLPVRVRFAAPLATPGGPVAMADARLRILCKGGTVSTTAVAPRTAAGRAFVARDRKAATAAARAALAQVLSMPAVVDSLCRR